MLTYNEKRKIYRDNRTQYHKDQVRAKEKMRYDNMSPQDKQKLMEKLRAYYEANKEKIKQYHRDYYHKNKKI